jgi:predicted metal-dependent phosphoesterase TrpH
MAAIGLACDLHVHSVHSGPAAVPWLGRVGNESYSAPEEVRAVARSRGMDLFTLTDHDSVDGVLPLRGAASVFVSEELTLEIPGGRQLHLGVFDLDERQHAALQARRRDPEALFALLAEERLPAAVNHLFSALTGPRQVGDFDLVLGHLDLVETRNAMLPASTNHYARRAARLRGGAEIGGSDAHTLAHVARAFTIVPGAGSREEYLDGLRRALTIPAGRSGSYARLTADVTRLCAQGYADGLRTAVKEPGRLPRAALLLGLLPLLPLIPVVTAAAWARELSFGARHFRAFAEALPRRLGAEAPSRRFGPGPGAREVVS